MLIFQTLESQTLEFHTTLEFQILELQTLEFQTTLVFQTLEFQSLESFIISTTEFLYCEFLKSGFLNSDF